LRRAVRFGRDLGLREPFLYRLVDVVTQTMGNVFPEVRDKRDKIKDVIRVEEDAFNKTIDRGMDLLTKELRRINREGPLKGKGRSGGFVITAFPKLSGFVAFTLYDTYGFPLDLTELVAG